MALILVVPVSQTRGARRLQSADRTRRRTGIRGARPPKGRRRGLVSLFLALTLFQHLIDGFHNRDLRALVADLLGVTSAEYTASQMELRSAAAAVEGIDLPSARAKIPVLIGFRPPPQHGFGR